MLVTPNFHMNGNCKEAIAIYEKALGATVNVLYCSSDANPKDYQSKPDEANLVCHAELMIGAQRVTMCDDIGAFRPRATRSLCCLPSIRRMKSKRPSPFYPKVAASSPPSKAPATAPALSRLSTDSACAGN